MCYYVGVNVTSTVNDELHRIQNLEGEWVLAWGCGCGEPPNTPMAVVKYDEPVHNIEYGFHQVGGLEKLERVDEAE